MGFRVKIELSQEVLFILIRYLIKKHVSYINISHRHIRLDNVLNFLDIPTLSWSDVDPIN